MHRITHDVWDELFRASVREYNSIIGADDPELSDFQKTRSKMINWHGTADQAIPPQRQCALLRARLCPRPYRLGLLSLLHCAWR